MSESPEYSEDDIRNYKNQHSEQDVLKAIAVECRANGYEVKRYKKLKFGSIDLIAWNTKQTIIFEVKYSDLPYSGVFHGILEALGQLLCYREQYRPFGERIVKYVIYSTGEIEWDSYYFLKQLCANYGVILHARLVELVKYL